LLIDFFQRIIDRIFKSMLKWWQQNSAHLNREGGIMSKRHEQNPIPEVNDCTVMESSIALADENHWSAEVVYLAAETLRAHIESCRACEEQLEEFRKRSEASKSTEISEKNNDYPSLKDQVENLTQRYKSN
jgi:hypothetical protein